MVGERKKKADEEDPDPSPYLFVTREQKMKDQAMPYDGKTMVWIPDEKECFILGTITKEEGGVCTVDCGKGDIRKVPKEKCESLNPPKYEKCEDMSNLTYLNDPSVLHNLKQRYINNLIYTYSGLFCVTINPYIRFPIYTKRCMAMYRGRRRTEMPPHLFAICDGAYSDMLSNRENQSCLITGESGAGKTENTKKVIAYLANIGATAKKEGADNKPSLEEQVVQTNPPLEAYGNAKTVRNDNSSRFGKFIRIHFSPMGKLAGADIETYLLEKARVVSQMELERSYHIFYQMMTGAVPNLKELCLLSDDIYDYHYVSQGKVTVPSIDDSEEMLATDEAFHILGFTQEQIDDNYKITAAVMHFGEMKFKQRPREEQAEADGTEVGEKVAHLLGLNAGDLYKNLCKPKIKVGNEFVTQGKSKDQVAYAISGLAKGMFDRLFKWIVKMCNVTLDTQQKRASFIGVLDIAGFEIFDFNTFEQLCINFTNEKLQQFFNHHMFVLEQEEYKKEGIDWVFIDFGMDLAACIELIEKPLGIMSILEEETMFPKSTDKTFEEKLLSNHLGKSACFQKPKPPKPGQQPAHFALVHYAGTVNYNITGWLEKNKDPLNDCVVDQFKKGGNKLLVELFADHPGLGGDEDAGGKGGGGGKGGKGGGRKKGSGFATVSSLYREQLNKLMVTLKSTHPHFIRCIVPNEFKKPGVVDNHLVMHQLTCNGVLEGIRICRKGFPNRMVYPDFKQRYTILAASAIAGMTDSKEASATILKTIEMPADNYRCGATKVFFKAGQLGVLEELREEKVSKIVTWVQSWMRWYLTKRNFRKLQEQRIALLIIQRNLRAQVQLRTWLWWKLFSKVKPILGMAKVEDEINALREKVKQEEEEKEKEKKLRAELELQNVKLLQEKAELAEQLDLERSASGDVGEKLQKITNMKADLEEELKELQDKLKIQEGGAQAILEAKKKLEASVSELRKQMEDLELALQKAEQEKASKDNQIRNLNEEISHQDELISKLNKEKKNLQDVGQKSSEEVQAIEDKVNHLTKVKTKLESTLDELEEGLDREKKARAEIEKTKRKLESDLKLAQETIAELERNKKELETIAAKKEKDIVLLNGKLEDEQTHVAKLQKNIKELQARVEELEEELESERQARTKAEKQRGDLSREIEELSERLDEAGGANSSQIELNKRREAELAKLRRDIEEANLQHEQAVQAMKKKQADSIQELSEQIEIASKNKIKLEKEKNQFKSEADDIRSSVDHIAKEKANLERQNKQLETQIAEVQHKLEDVTRAISDLDTQKKRIAAENADLQRQLEEVDQTVGTLTKLRNSLQGQLDEAKRISDEESRERAAVMGKYRNLEHDIDGLREQLEEEIEAKADLARQLAKANAEGQVWREKYEKEGLARLEGLEEEKKRIAAKLADTQEQIEQLNVRCSGLEKAKQRLQGENEDLSIELERARAAASALEKKQRSFDKVVAEWKHKVDDLAVELDASQKECRNYSTELYKLRASHDEAIEHYESVKRENKNLQDEIRDLLDQLGDGGRIVHELDKARKRLESEKEELQAALEEAEAALEAEENKVLRSQLELAQVRQEIDRRLQEKEEEFENTRRNHQKALESLQSSLESEARQKAEALRMKKKLESDINELEIGLDHANKSIEEGQKSIRKYQQALKDIQLAIEEETRARDNAREQQSAAERRAAAVQSELEETRRLLEQADRIRRNCETELNEVHDRNNELGAQNQSLSMAKRKLEGEIQALSGELEEMLNEARSSEEKAKKAMVDAARLADELRAEQENALQQEKLRKQAEITLKELQIRLDDAEAAALKGGKKTIQKLEQRVRELESEFESEQRRHNEAAKNLRRAERKVKELTFQAEEDRKNHERMQDLVDKLQQKIKTYKRQIEEAEEIAALNLAKFRKGQQELEEAMERADLAENSVHKMRARQRQSASVSRGMSPRRRQAAAGGEE